MKTSKSIILFSIFSNALLLLVPVYTLVIYDKILSTYNLSTLEWITFFAVLLILIYGLLEGLKQTILKRIAVNNEQNTTSLLLSQVDSLAQENAKSSEQVLGDIKKLAQYKSTLEPLIYDIPWAFIFIGLMFVLHPVLGYVMSVITITALALTYLSNKEDDTSDANILSQKTAYTFRYPQFLFLFKSIDHFTEWWNQEYKKATSNKNITKLWTNLASSLHKALRVGSSIAILATGATLVIYGEITPGTMIAGSMISGRVLTPLDHIWKIIRERNKTNEIKQKIKKFEQALREMNKNSSSIEPENQIIKLEKINLKNIDGTLALRDISFEIPANKIVAISGETGSGKTVLLKTLSGMIKPSSGMATLGNADLFKINKSYLHYSPLNFSLAPVTIEENLIGMEKNNEERDILVESTGLRPFLSKLQKGYLSHSSEIPPQLLTSGTLAKIRTCLGFSGQKKIRTFDDIDCGMDLFTINAFKKLALTAKSRGETVIYSSHHKSMLDIADLLIVLKEGTVANIIDLKATKNG